MRELTEAELLILEKQICNVQQKSFDKLGLQLAHYLKMLINEVRTSKNRSWKIPPKGGLWTWDDTQSVNLVTILHDGKKVCEIVNDDDCTTPLERGYAMLICRSLNHYDA
jgi:hypothetical protein